jgi:hypothetical protein
MTFNPFEKIDDACLEAVSLIKIAFESLGFMDSVLPGRTIPNQEELPASLVYLSDPVPITSMDGIKGLGGTLTVVTYIDSKRFHPEKLLNQRAKVIFATLNDVKLPSGKERSMLQSFDYETDPDTALTSLTMDFSLKQ